MWGKCYSPYGACVVQWNDCCAVEKLYFSAQVDFDGERSDDEAARLCERIFNDQPVKVALVGSELELAVWNELRKIPQGQIRTYSQIALSIGKERAVRAVASAIGRNEISYLVPCHRVVRKDGSLGGYRWGLNVKQKLLNKEQTQTTKK